MATHSTAERHHPNYMAIFWWLLGLTVGEVIVILLPLPRSMVVVLLIGFALSKAMLVAMYFMHLRFERVPLGVIAVTPLILCVFLVLMLLPDLSTETQPSNVPTQKVVIQQK